MALKNKDFLKHGLCIENLPVSLGTKQNMISKKHGLTMFFVGFAPEERGTLGMKQNKDFKN